MAVIATPAFGDTIVDDSFADGDRSITGASGSDTEIAFFSTSNSSAIEDNADDGANIATVGLVSGTSGRQIHATFASQTLATAGDSVAAYVTFTTPGVIASTSSQADVDAAITASGDNISAGIPASGDDLRIGLFSTSTGPNGTTSGPATGLANDISNASGAGNENAALNINGYAIELDVEPANDIPESAPGADDAVTFDTDIDLREYLVANSTGRLLGTNTGSSSINSTGDLDYSFAANTEYTVHQTYTLNAAGGLDVTVDFLEAGVSLGTLSFTDDTPATLEFGTLALGASSEAFGLDNDAGDADNGIDLNNVTIHSTIAVIPEPSSLALLGLFGCAGFIRRRR